MAIATQLLTSVPEKAWLPRRWFKRQAWFPPETRRTLGKVEVTP